MEFLTARGPEEIDDWSVSLEQDAIGTQETVKETRLELKRRFALAANVLDEETAQLKQQAAQQSRSQTLHTGALQLLSADETQISGLRSLEILNLHAIPFAAQNNTPLWLFTKEAEQKGTIDERPGG